MTSRAATRDAAETPGRIPGPVLTVRRHAEGVGAVTSETRHLRDVAKTAGRLTGPVETVRCRTESNVAALGEARRLRDVAKTAGRLTGPIQTVRCCTEVLVADTDYAEIFDRQQMELKLTAKLFLQTDNEKLSGLLAGGIDLFVAAGLLLLLAEVLLNHTVLRRLP